MSVAAQPILQARGITRSFAGPRGPIEVIKGADLEVHRGQFIAIMGPSGAGKSSLLHILGGLEQPTGGSVLIEGADINAIGDADRARLRREKTSFIFQFFNLIPYLSAEDNILLPYLLGGGERGRDYRKRSHEIMDDLGLKGHEQSLPDQLAGGEQQRVAVGRALLLRPPLILADEPTGNLDFQTGRDILQLLWRTVYDWGRSLILVTHDAGSAAYAERVLVMRDGKWVADVPLRKLDPTGWEKHDAKPLISVLQELGL